MQEHQAGVWKSEDNIMGLFLPFTMVPGIELKLSDSRCKAGKHYHPSPLSSLGFFPACDLFVSSCYHIGLKLDFPLRLLR